MKKLLLGLVALAVLTGGAFSIAKAQVVFPPRPTSFVTDIAEMLAPEAEASLEARLVALEQETGTEFAVVTIPSLEGDTIENTAVELFEQWGIGKAKEDNGVLLLVARDDKKIKIEVGYGLEGALTDGTAGAILDSFVIPAFRAGDFELGIVNGADEILRIVRGGVLSGASVEEKFDSTSLNGLAFAFIFFVNSIFALLGYMASTKSFWLGGILGMFIGLVFAYFFGFYLPFVLGYGLIGLLLDFILSRYNLHVSTFRMWRNFWGGGGSGGGFGGFGGGSSGGGGSSRSW